MAEADSTLMLEILKDIRRDVTGLRRDVTGIRTDVADLRKDVAHIREEQQDFRKDLDSQRSLLQMTVDTVRKLQQTVDNRFLDMRERMKAHKDDLELMLKAELLGALASFQSKIELYVDRRLAVKTE